MTLSDARKRREPERELDEDQEDRFLHILNLNELTLRYVYDCDGVCANCKLGHSPTNHSVDLPELPSGLMLCHLFDYISQNLKP